jgi:malonyl-CoA O-methyltransferase
MATTSDAAAGRVDHDASPDARVLARVARRWAAREAPPWLHAEVSRRMAERLVLFKAQPRRIVQWWGPHQGDAPLRSAYPSAAITVAAPGGAPPPQRAPSWWQRVARRPGASSGASLVSDDAITSAGAELLWANMVLHARADVPALLARWHDALAIDGTLMFSTIGPDTLRELRQLYRDKGWGPPAAEPADMHDIGDALVHAGFVMDQERLTLRWADAQALLRELRELGANASNARHAGLRTPRWRDALLAALQGLAAADGRIALSFEIVYGHAFKVAPRARAATSVPLDALASTLPSRRRP